MKFQACVGPSMNKVHLRAVPESGKDIPLTTPERLTLCKATAWVRDYRAALAIENLCRLCNKEYFLRCMTAENLGVSELILSGIEHGFKRRTTEDQS